MLGKCDAVQCSAVEFFSSFFSLGGGVYLRDEHLSPYYYLRRFLPGRHLFILLLLFWVWLR